MNATTDKQFTGHQAEGELYYMKARFYDPSAGRFLQPDSIVPDPANPQSLNRYSYVYNNPMSHTDPTGHRPATCFPDSFVPCQEARPAPPPTHYDDGTPIGGCTDCTELDIINSLTPITGFVCDVNVIWTGTTCSGQSAPFLDRWILTPPSVVLPGNLRFADDFVARLGRPAGRLLGFADEGSEAAEFLRAGPANMHVYLGVKGVLPIYAGRSGNVAKRLAQHNTFFEKFDRLVQLTAEPLTTGQARAIEAALIVDNPTFVNAIHSIDSKHSYYEEVVNWGRKWLRQHGH